MARRSAPPHSGPSYLPPIYATPGRAPVDPNESKFQRFLREQVFSPDKLPGNLNIITSSLLFLGGIVVMRSFGEAIVADI
ncbi:hypothetical protein Clacol_003129 [Clathrus columnatus]|uniref:Uncharacterized protein n=1 Tax=Clathrus columnatus TaxID=1419009 RepID=A0AAV5A2N0_9AGAM|nr:hypothetical protein Clacol_003129 [Clathrus columnatus]